MKASDLFVRALEAEGVEYVFAIPGEENLDLLESLRGSKIKLVVTRHEQAAGFMAATYGRLTGKAGVCLATLGPGATNFVTAAAYAQLGAMPMVMITGQKPIKSSKQGQFQIIDVVDMMRPLTKFTRQIVSGDSVPSRIREAFRLAQEERPGATHLELPEDIAREHSPMPVLQPSNARRPVPEEKAIQKAAEAISAARKPLLLLGAAANRKLTAKMVQAFVDKRLNHLGGQLAVRCGAKQQQWFARCADRFGCLLNGFFFGHRSTRITRLQHRHGRMFTGDILRQLQMGGAGALFLSQPEGFADPRGDAVTADDLPGELGQWPHHVNHINDLELALLGALDRLLPGDHDHWHGAELGVGSSSHKIGGAGP